MGFLIYRNPEKPEGPKSTKGSQPEAAKTKPQPAPKNSEGKAAESKAGKTETETKNGEGKGAESKAEKPEKKLTPKEKKILIQNYRNTQKRLELAYQKLHECRKIIEELPKDNDAYIQAEKLYKEAEALVQKIGINLKDIDFNMEDDVKMTDGNRILRVANKLEQEAESKYQEFLRINGIDGPGMELYVLHGIEGDAVKMLKIFDDFKKAGFSKDEAIHILTGGHFNKGAGFSVNGFLKYALRAKKMKIPFAEAFKLWNELGNNKYKPEDILQIIDKMMKAGIQDHFLEVLAIGAKSRPEGELGTPEALETAQNFIKMFQEKGLSREEAVQFLHEVPEKPDKVIADLAGLDLNGVSIISVLTFYFHLSDYRRRANKERVGSWGREAIDFRRSMVEMLNAGIKENFMEVESLHSLVSSSKPKSYREIVGFISACENSGIEGGRMESVFTANIDPVDFGRYFNKFPKEIGVHFDEIIDLYKDGIGISRKAGKDGQDVIDFADLTKFYKSYRELQENDGPLKNENFVDFLVFNRADHTDYRSKYGSYKEYLIGVTSKMKELGLWSMGQMAILRALPQVEEKDYKQYRSEAIMNRNPATAIAFIKNIESLEFHYDAKFICLLWNYVVGRGMDELVFSRVLKKFHSENKDVAVSASGISSPGDRPVVAAELINFFKAYSSFDSGRQPVLDHFLRHIKLRSAMITFGNLTSFMEDPTLPLSLKVYELLGNGDVALALKIGRNMFYQGYKEIPSGFDLLQQMNELDRLQAESDNIKIFEGRNVVFVRNRELWGENPGVSFTEEERGKRRFGSPEFYQLLRRAVGPDGTCGMEGLEDELPTAQKLAECKKRILNNIKSTPPPMTFYFDGHGGSKELFINNGQIQGERLAGNDSDLLTADEIAEAVASRKQKFPGREKELRHDIYIFASCYNHSFIRNMYAKNAELGGVQPISMGNSEYGQYAFNSMEDVSHVLLGLGSEKATTLGDIRENESKYTDSDYTVYVANEEGQPQQVVKAKLPDEDQPRQVVKMELPDENKNGEPG